jgi:hypothetical protein
MLSAATKTGDMTAEGVGLLMGGLQDGTGTQSKPKPKPKPKSATKKSVKRSAS